MNNYLFTMYEDPQIIFLEIPRLKTTNLKCYPIYNAADKFILICYLFIQLLYGKNHSNNSICGRNVHYNFSSL